VPAAPTVVRATTVLLACAGSLAACAVAAPTRAAAGPVAPSTTAVVGTRFAVAVELDHEGLLVTPPPAGALKKATVTASEADTLFEATDAVEGPHAFAIFGLGLVTVAPSLEAPVTTTTTTVPATAPSTSVPLSTTTSPSPTTAPTTTTTTTTTTVPPTTTTTAGPGQTTAVGAVTTTTAPLPTYRRRLAWVGNVWGAPSSCSGPTTTQPTATGPTSYVAVVIDARSDDRVLAYRSGGSAPCTGTPVAPAVTEPDELLSVPWQPVGPASTAVQVQLPACGAYYGWTQVPAPDGAQADQVVAAVPIDPTCGSAPQTQLVDQVVPLGSGQSQVGHAALGPIQALQND